jgi:hypothetical protein
MVAAETVLIGAARLVMPPHSSSNNPIAIAIKTTRMAASYACHALPSKLKSFLDFFSHKKHKELKIRSAHFEPFVLLCG